MAQDYHNRATINADIIGDIDSGDGLSGQELGMMIDWGKFSDMLSQSIKDGVRYSMVMKYDGSLLACAGAQPLPKDFKRIVPSLVVSMWKSTQDVGKKFVNAIGLDFMIFNCKLGRVGLTHLSPQAGYFVCLIVSDEMELGHLKIKTELVADQLSKPLLGDYSEDEEDDDDDEDDDDNEDNDGNDEDNTEPVDGNTGDRDDINHSMEHSSTPNNTNANINSNSTNSNPNTSNNGITITSISNS